MRKFLSIIACALVVLAQSCSKSDDKPLIPVFEVQEAEGLQIIPAGTEKSYTVNAENIDKCIIQSPIGWSADYSDQTLTISAPAEENTDGDASGVVSICVTSKSGESLTVNIEVAQYELRYLTFEDTDTKFAAYTLEYCGKSIAKWSDLIDEQYGGPLLYNDYSSAEYYWFDENNTGLFSTLPFGGPFWMGGEAISNYYDADFSDKSYTDQLCISVEGGAEGKAGHNGSANFCVHFGYSSFEATGNNGCLVFADGQARIIDHMYVTNIGYGLNSLVNGDGFNPAATPTTWVKIIAEGYDENDALTGTSEFYLCKDGVPVNKWSKFDLSSLGKVVKVHFYFDASADQSGSYGLNFPAYFAYDDVAVRF